MVQKPASAAEVFSVAEIARVAGASPAAVREFIERRQVPSAHGLVAASYAVRCVRLIRRERGLGRRGLFAPPLHAQRSPVTGAISSAAVHAGILGGVLLLTSLGVSTRAIPLDRPAVTRLVFLATPGPGGGGGGGGRKEPAPPPKAQLKTASRLRSPVPPPRPLTTRKPEPVVERPVPRMPTPHPTPREEPPPPPPVVSPQVIAPVATASADARDRAGVLTESAAAADSHGRGSGGGAGTGQGTGIGEGTGAGIGPGSGGGTGGGPYRPGSGITAPDLLREVRPVYTDEARRLGIEGEVVLEIIVQADGTVGNVRVVQGLRGGLDRRAIEAVRQWRFAPARRYGAPVDVLVEIAVEFKLR
jgi:periplasmic protein TonB